MTSPIVTTSALVTRIESLGREIAAAQAKLPRAHEAIRSRQATLARLQAQLALNGESRPAQRSYE